LIEASPFCFGVDGVDKRFAPLTQTSRSDGAIATNPSRLRKRGFIPNAVVILTCLDKKGRVNEALVLYEQMKKDAMPNV